MPNGEFMRVYIKTNLLLKYNWHLDLTNNKAAINLRLQSVNRYWRYVTQVANKLSHLSDFLPALIVFMNKTCGNYN